MTKWKRTAVLVACMMVCSVAGCGNSKSAQTDISEAEVKSTGESQSSKADVAEKISLKISHHPYIHALPSIYAEKNGLYDTFDYTIDYYASGPVQNEAVASNAWEVGTTGIGGAILGAVGYDMKVIAATCSETNTNDLWVRADSPLAKAGKGENGIYGSAQDWKGLKILCQTGTVCHLTLIATLDSLGLNENDVEIVDTAVAQSYAAFKAGQADVVALWSPFGFEAEKEGWVKVSSASAVGLELPCLVVATEKAVNERPEVVQQWLEAYLKAVDGLKTDQDASAAMLYRFEEEQGIVMSEENAKREIETRPFPTLDENKEYFKENGGSSKMEEILLRFTDFMIDQGKLSEADKEAMMDKGFVDGSFIEKVR